MTSPVDTSVKFFTNTMVNAPVLNGVAGSLVALLDAVLKDGFDTKTLVSLVAAGGVMTATYSGAHSSALDTVVLIAGVTGGPSGWAGANGEQKVTAAPTATTRTWATALPDGTYTGTITMKMAPLGWLKPFTGTNKGAYKSADITANPALLRVDDSNAQFARVVGYVTMSDIDTGTEPFPSVAQMSGGGYWCKSSAANSFTTQWVIWGDAKMFYFFNAPGYASAFANTIGVTRCFGDPVAYKPSGDPYCTVLNYSNTATAVNQWDGGLDTQSNVLQFATPRNHTGLGSSALYIKNPQSGNATLASGVDTTLGAYPSAQVDGALRLSKLHLIANNTNNGPRAEFPGVYHAPHTGVVDTFKTFDTVPGGFEITGRQLMAVNNTNNTAFNTALTSANAGSFFFDKTGPWRV